MKTFSTAFQEVTGSAPPTRLNAQLEKYWNRPVRELCQLEDSLTLRPEEKERHRIYCYLLMAIVYHYWNCYKHGRRGEYPWHDAPVPTDPAFYDGDYLGHNIAALAVDTSGRVLDFDFNHNTLFNSSAEHAEARLVRRLYSLAQISEAWSAAPDPGLALGDRAGAGGRTSLTGVTIYTSLESCSQCSGVMALARVKEVVYLQTDPGQYFIGRILRNLTSADMRAPLPISGGEVDLKLFGSLNASFSEFIAGLRATPFWIGPDGRRDTGPSVTSFLCTRVPRAAFASGGDLLARLTNETDGLEHSAFRPQPQALSNGEVVSEAEQFLRYAIAAGRRGTPHNL